MSGVNPSRWPTFAERLEAMTEEKPDAIAFRTPAMTYSRREVLDHVTARAESLRATWSKARGTHLPVAVDFSAESYLTLATCVWAGIPVAPFDPESPTSRLERLWDLLGNPEFVWVPPALTNWEAPAGVAVVTDATPHQEPSPMSVMNLEAGLALFTSGSTGEPKAVGISYETLTWRLARNEQELDLSETIRVSAFTPLHFIGGFQRLTRMFLGAEVHVLDPKSLGLRDLIRWIDESEITHLHIPPQLARLVAQAPDDYVQILPSVRELRIGSEGVRGEVLQGLRRYLSDETLVRHGLGSSEGSNAMRNTFPISQAPQSGVLPVGRVMYPECVRLHTQADYPDGVSEVWLSGPIASGYIGNEQLTKERFVRDEQGTRWWRSGDLVRQNQEGLFVHVGRIDDAVKVKGMWASPSEATSALVDLPEVRAACVFPVDFRGTVTLVAHVELVSGATATARQLEGILLRRLPRHVVPSRYLFHEALPINARGKIDRERLRHLTSGDDKPDQAHHLAEMKVKQ